MSKTSLSKLILILVSIFNQIHAQFCSAQCQMLWNGTKYVFGSSSCTSSAVDSCLICDTDYYDLQAVAGVCIQSASSKYNQTLHVGTTVNVFGTVGVDFTYPSGDIGDVGGTGGLLAGHNCIKFTYQGTVTHTATLPTAVGHYAIRFKLLLYNTDNPAFTFSVPGFMSESIPILNVISSSIYSSYWVHTTGEIQHTTATVTIVFSRTDAGASGDNPGLCDVWILLAQCVQNCISCVSLTTCTACAAGFLLDQTTKLCATTCPIITYNTGASQCAPCDVKCLICSGALATQCTKCVDTGRYESFLLGSTCHFADCPSGYIQNYENHTCDCPNGYFDSGVVCTACDPFCTLCTTTSINCQACTVGYFHYNTTDTCAATCPAGEYANLIYDRAACYLCDTTHCVHCLNSSTTCTNCNFGVTPARYLFNYTCMETCPHGYEGNNVTFVCDQCLLGKYSYFNKCYSYCPDYYQANDVIRACVLPGGFPLNMSVEVKSKSELKFKIEFKVKLSSAWITFLSSQSNWEAFLTMNFRTQTENQLYVDRRRLYTSSQKSISEVSVDEDSLVLVLNSVEAEIFSYTHTFDLRFSDNLESPDGVFYQISTEVSMDDNPWVLKQYFDLNIVPYYLIGIFFALAALIVLLMRIKDIYRITIEYLHCIQLLGLTVWAAYPHTMTVHLYSFLKGLDYSNFEFMYNPPRELIEPCLETCISMTSYAFMQGDMSWLRLIGGMIICLFALLLIFVIIKAFKCSQAYSSFFIVLICDILLIKALHSWSSSLIYAVINLIYNYKDFDLFISLTHAASYIILLPLMIPRIMQMHRYKYPNISCIATIIFVILLSLISLAPLLVSAILLTLVFLEFVLLKTLNIGDQEVPLRMQMEEKGIKYEEKPQEGIKKRTAHEIIDGKEVINANKKEEEFQDSLEYNFHFYLFRSMKPMTAILAIIILTLEFDRATIGVVSGVLGLYFCLILMDGYLMYTWKNPEKVRKSPRDAKRVGPVRSNEKMNETKEDLKDNDEKMQAKMVIYDEDEMDNDDIVSNKFRETRGKGRRGRKTRDTLELEE